MIGGIDIRLPSSAGLHSVEASVRALRQLWPHAVFEDGNTGTRFDRLWQIPFDQIEELFVYRDPVCADVWEKRGAIPEVFNTMIHILHDDGLITAVIDERTPEMDMAIDAIRSALSDNILFTHSLLEAA